MGSISGRGTASAKVGGSGKARGRGGVGGLRRPWKGLLCAGASGPREAVIWWAVALGRHLDGAGAPGLTRTGLPGLLACGRVSGLRAAPCSKGVKGLVWAWTPGRASWRSTLSCAWLTREKGP